MPLKKFEWGDIPNEDYVNTVCLKGNLGLWERC